MKENPSSSSLPHPIHHPTPLPSLPSPRFSHLLPNSSPLGPPTAVTKGAFSLSAVIAVSAQRRKRPQVPKHPKPQMCQVQGNDETNPSSVDSVLLHWSPRCATEIEADLNRPTANSSSPFVWVEEQGPSWDILKANTHLLITKNLHQNCGGTQIPKIPMKSNVVSNVLQLSSQPFLMTSPPKPRSACFNITGQTEWYLLRQW